MAIGNLIHLFYDLGPYAEAQCAIFEQQGSSLFTLFFKKASDITVGEYQSDDSMIFKIPAGYPATLELEEVAVMTPTAVLGMYKVTMHLLPSKIKPKTEKLSAEEQKQLTILAETETGACAGTPECPGPYICQPGQVVKKVAGQCGCFDPGA